MKVRMPKSFATLPQSEKDMINNLMTEQVLKEVNHNMAELQKVWLQYACIILNKNFGLDENACILFISNWHNIYKINAKFTTKEEQTAFIKCQLDEIFIHGYPQQFIDKMEDIT